MASFLVVLAAASVTAMGGPLQPTSIADAKLTPGSVNHALTPQSICQTKWGTDERAVGDAMKARVYQAYGFAGKTDPRCTPDRNGHGCEVDHRIPRCLGGADEEQNLSPQPYGGAWNAHMKDRLETMACRKVCAASKPLPLDQARQIFTGDWTTTYRAWFGEPPTP